MDWGREGILGHLVRSFFPLAVIPDLIRNPVFLNWIPAFAGMTDSEIM